MEGDEWRAYIYNGGTKNCSEYIVPNEQEAMNQSACVNYRKYLYKCLLHNYIKELSPMEDSKQLYEVQYSFTVNEILDISTEGTIQISKQIYLAWLDGRLTWDTST